MDMRAAIHDLIAVIILFLLGIVWYSCEQSRSAAQVRGKHAALTAQVDSLRLVITDLEQQSQKVDREIVVYTDTVVVTKERVLEILPQLTTPVQTVVREYIANTDSLIARYQRLDSLRVAKIDALQQQVSLLEDQNRALHQEIRKAGRARKALWVGVGVLGVVALLK